MNARYKYTMLISSLPVHHLDLLISEQTPLSRIQLNKRLALLDEADRADLAHLENLLGWAQHGNLSDGEFIAKVEKILPLIENDFAKDALLWRLELRTIMSALRQRHLGLEPPEKDAIGFGKWAYFIHKNWHEPDFGIGKQVPWVMEANSLLTQSETLELEKFLSLLVWNHYARAGNLHYFDFEAVISYVLRWDVIRRWECYDKQKAEMRFDELVNAGLKDVRHFENT